MSDQDAQSQAELLTRKSSRQKTPNTYYQQDISEIRGDQKPKIQKQVSMKISKPKKKSDKQTVKSNPSSILSQFGQFLQPPQRVSKQSFSLEGQNSNIEELGDKQDQMEAESNPHSNVGQTLDQEESPSQSNDESKKSDQNNANRSFSENDENSNKATGGYQTRKIRKKPKFADENYIDNMPPPKAVLQKKSKSSKSEISHRRNSKNSIQIQDLSSFSPPRDRYQGKSSKPLNKSRNDHSTNNGDKKRDQNTKKEESHDFLNGGLLGLFLDTVVQVNQQSLVPSENDKKGKDVSHINSSLTNQAMEKDFQAATLGSSQSSHNNIALKNKKGGEEESRKRRQQVEDSTNLRKKIKPSRKTHEERDNLSLLSLLQVDSQQQLSSQQSQKQVMRNGTLFYYPDLNPKSDFITHVEKKTDKLILHHSSQPQIELNGYNAKREFMQKIQLEKLIQQINQRQLKQQQQNMQNNDSQILNESQQEDEIKNNTKETLQNYLLQLPIGEDLHKVIENSQQQRKQSDGKSTLLDIEVSPSDSHSEQNISNNKSNQQQKEIFQNKNENNLITQDKTKEQTDNGAESVDPISLEAIQVKQKSLFTSTPSLNHKQNLFETEQQDTNNQQLEFEEQGNDNQLSNKQKQSEVQISKEGTQKKDIDEKEEELEQNKSIIENSVESLKNVDASIDANQSSLEQIYIISKNKENQNVCLSQEHEKNEAICEDKLEQKCD